MIPYPIQNLVVGYDSNPAKFAELSKLPASALASLRREIVSIRQAAAVSLGLDPRKFANIEMLPSGDVQRLLIYGPKRGKGIKAMFAGRREFYASAKAGALPVVRKTQSLAEALASDGGEVTAEMEAVLARIEKRCDALLSTAATAKAAMATVAPDAVVPAATAAAVKNLTGHAKTAEAFNLQFKKFPGASGQSGR